MKVAVCDDQEIFLKAVYNEVKSLSYLEISLFDDSTKLAEEIKNGEYYDLFILDIEMPNLDGMELAKVIKEHIKNPVIIFLTSYTDYVYNAFECEGLVRMFLRFRFCGIVCCVLYRFPFPQSDL